MRFMPSFIKLREQAEQAVTTLPNILIHAEKLADSILHGEHTRRKAGTGEKFWQYREYVEGDRPQDIDWRQSAKTDQVFIKQKEWQITRKTFFWCNISGSMAFQSKTASFLKQDYARILTLSLAILLRKNKEQIGIYGQPQSGRSEKMIETIGHALFEKQRYDLPADNISALPKDAYFIGIGDFLNPYEDIEKSLDRVAQRTENALIIQILDPAELSLPFEGRVEFSDHDHNNKNLVNSVQTIRTQYQDRIQKHCKSIEKLCTSKGWSYYQCITDQSPELALHNIYTILEQNGGR